MSRASWGSGLAAVAALAAPYPASAAELALSMSDCSSLSEAVLREHLALELSTLGLSATPIRLDLRCANGVVEVQARGDAEPVATTTVSVQDTARGARERLVALAVSELVAQARRAREVDRARRAKEELDSVAASPVASPRRPERVAPKLPPAGMSVRELSVAAGASSLGAPRVLLWGAALGARVGFGSSWSLLADARYDRGTDGLERADVRWTSVSALVGAAGSLRCGPVDLSAAVGVRVGALFWAAEARLPDQSGALTAPWAGIALPLRAAWGSERFHPFVGVEAGYVTLPVRGKAGDDGSVLVDHRGAWVSGSLGLAVAL